MNPLQALADSVSANAQVARRETGMTLGSFIGALEKLSPKAWVSLDFCSLRPGKFMSYRGYYCDLALGFSSDSGGANAEDLLAEAKACMGKTFEGYKGGEYLMGETTPLWVANYGDTGWRITGIRVTNYEHSGSQYAAIEARPEETDDAP